MMDAWVHLIPVVGIIALCGATATHAGGLNVGSKRFTESYILGEIIAQTADQAGEARAVHKPGLGNTAVVFEALKNGAIDVYPEYTGTVAREILRLEAVPGLGEISRRLAPMGLGVGVPLGFNNTYALAMPEEKAQALGIRSLSDLAKHPTLRLGLSQEFIGRADGWEGLKRAYALPFATPRGLDHGLSYQALEADQVDVTDVYTTDAKIERYKLRVLADDKRYFPAYDAVLLYRLDLPQRMPGTWAALQALEGRIPEQRMIELNAAAELHGQSFAAVANAFVRDSKLSPQTRNSFAARLLGPDFWRLTREHLLLVLVSVIGAVLAGVPLGLLADRVRSARQAILATTGMIQTIPSLALFAFLIPVLGTIGAAPALVALFLYALLPITRNTYEGLAAVRLEMKQAATALGLSPRMRLRYIELPLAAPMILAGIKTSAVINVGTATIAAFIGAGGYGERIVQGLALNDDATLLAGAVPAAALALIVHFGFELADRWLVPAPLRGGGRK